jgi:N-acetylmuramoyl-L-alanine amidase
VDPHDLDYLVRTVWGEARGEPPEGQQAVASVILNRASQAGQGIRDIVLAPAQFSPWHDPRARAELTSLRADSPDYQRIAANIQPALEGHDATGGADHFFAPKLANPEWAQGAAGHDIGNHRFLKLGYSGTGRTGGAMPTAAELLNGGKPAAAGGLPTAAELLGGAPAAPGSSTVPLKPSVPMKASQALGFQKGAVKPWDNAAIGLEWLVDKATGSAEPGRFSHMLGQPSARDAADSHAAYVTSQRAKGIVPGKVGEFAGNVVGTAPLALLPGGVMTQGAAGGALLSDATDAKGLARDAAIGAATGKLADIGLNKAGSLASTLLSKVPKVMSVPELEAAKKAAYSAVDGMGVTYKPSATKRLAADIAADVAPLRVSPLRHPAASSVLADVTATLKGNKPLSLSELDDLRQVVWRDAAGLKDPDRAAEAMIGQKIMSRLDDFMDTADVSKVTAGDPEAAAQAIREARDLNTRWRKSQTVSNELDSADLRKSAAYSGANTDNAIRQRIRPLVDPTSGKRIRNASPDEKAALRRIVEGTPLQNLSRLTGQGLDPRKLLGKISGIGAAGSAIPTGGLSLIGPAVGLIGTTVSNRASQRNVEELLRLIAAGGSTQALAKVPTAASRAAASIPMKVRPGLGLTAAALAAAARGGS